MSKHNTVINDFEESGQQAMNKLNFLEFLEFFARVAFIRFLNSEMEGLTLGEKLGHLMDEVFLACLGC